MQRFLWHHVLLCVTTTIDNSYTERLTFDARVTAPTRVMKRILLARRGTISAIPCVDPPRVSGYCSPRFRAPPWTDVEPSTMEGVPYENRHCARRSRLRPLGRVLTLASRPTLPPASPQADH